MSQVILLAEDWPDDVLLFHHLLKRLGVKNHVASVSNGAEAIAYITGTGVYADREQYPFPSVLFLDLKMPKVDGWDVLRWLKTNGGYEKLRVVVLTGWQEGKQLQEARELGADSYHKKPVELDEMRALITRWPEVWNMAVAGGDPAKN